MAALQFRLRILFGPRSSLGPGKIALLEEIKASGSLSEAARTLGMSYRRAWVLLDELNKGFAERSTVSAIGGSGGGGMRLTKFGQALIDSYRLFETQVESIGARRFSKIAAIAASRARGEVSRGPRRTGRRRLGA